jgi:hypothetical protein
VKLAIVISVATTLLLPVVMIGATGGALTAMEGGSAGWVGRPETLADVPGPFLALYQEAAASFGVPVGILAGIGKVECNHGRGDCYHPNQAGAEGPMQFLPATFAAYSWASGTADPSPYDPRDAIFAAAAKLANGGVGQDPATAIYSYNHAHWYVALVTAWATAYGYLPGESLAALAVLNHPNLSLRAEATADVRSGGVDMRVLAVLLILATTHQLQAVGPLISGHSYYVAGTSHPSNHAFGRVADLPIIDGAPVSAGNGNARSVAEVISHLPSPLRPDELGSPWPLTFTGMRTFTQGHHDHIHYGYDQH